MHKIEISDEVWQELRRLAIPFVDHTPDDVLRRVLAGMNGVMVKDKFPAGAGEAEAGLSPKERGKRARAAYVWKLQKEGLRVRLSGGIWAYLEDRDSWMAVASAGKQRADRWFLGIPEKEIDGRGRVFVVLLCQQDSGEMLDIVLPPEFVKENLRRLSVSKGQRKFNVVRVGKEYRLMIPRAEPEDISKYVGAWLALRT